MSFPVGGSWPAWHAERDGPVTGVGDVRAMVSRRVTLGLVSVILGTASSAQNVGGLSAVAVGAYIALAGLWSSPLSGASMNPVRCSRQYLIRGDLTHTWVYVVGPVAGAIGGGCGPA